MKFVRVKDKSTGHEFSEPADSPLIGKRLEVVGRKAATRLPLPAKHDPFKPKKNSPSAGDDKKEA